MERDQAKVDDPSQREGKDRLLSNITQFQKPSSFNIRPILETVRFRKSSNLKIAQLKKVQFQKRLISKTNEFSKLSNFQNRFISITVQFRKPFNFEKRPIS